jgi:hypothetical protein
VMLASWSMVGGGSGCGASLPSLFLCRGLMGENGELLYTWTGGLDDEADELVLEEVLVVGRDVDADEAEWLVCSANRTDVLVGWLALCAGPLVGGADWRARGTGSTVTGSGSWKMPLAASRARFEVDTRLGVGTFAFVAALAALGLAGDLAAFALGGISGCAIGERPTGSWGDSARLLVPEVVPVGSG